MAPEHPLDIDKAVGVRADGRTCHAREIGVLGDNWLSAV
jgi:hypothetical protein